MVRCKDCYVKKIMEAQRYCSNCLELHKKIKKRCFMENSQDHLLAIPSSETKEPEPKSED